VPSVKDPRIPRSVLMVSRERPASGGRPPLDSPGRNPGTPGFGRGHAVRSRRRPAGGIGTLMWILGFLPAQVAFKEGCWSEMFGRWRTPGRRLTGRRFVVGRDGLVRGAFDGDLSRSTRSPGNLHQVHRPDCRPPALAEWTTGR